MLMTVFALLLADFFDTMGTIVAVGAEGDLLDEQGTPPHLSSVLMVDSVAAAAGGIGSVSSNTSYVESVAGVGEGARTGLASVVTGVLFLAAMFLTPLTQIVPLEVAASALVIVGALMVSQIKDVDWTDFSVALPVFLTIITMPLTYSIANGIGAGFVSWVVVNAFSGKAKQVHWLLWIVAAGFVLYFARGPIETLLGA